MDVKRFQPVRHEDKVPCMGWNALYDLRSVIFDGLNGLNGLDGSNGANGVNGWSNGNSEPYVYFVHSYYVPLCPETIAVADYIQPYSAALQKDNFFATQFHPEKSGSVGEQIIRNFLEVTNRKS